MEAVEEHITSLPVTDVIKPNTEKNEDVPSAVAADLCHQSNGIAESKSESGQPELSDDDSKAGDLPDIEMANRSSALAEVTGDSMQTCEIVASSELEITADVVSQTKIIEPSADSLSKDHNIHTLEISEVITEIVIDNEDDKSQVGDGIDDVVLETSTDDTPKFRTEILIEANDSMLDTPDNISTDVDAQETPNNILSEFGESIELSDVLRSDITETLDNNNSSVRQEVFNKEELLDILEGNDVEPTSDSATDGKKVIAPSVETKLALQQLSRLKNEKRKYRVSRTHKTQKEALEKERARTNITEEQVEKNNLNIPENKDNNKVSDIGDKTNTEKKKSIHVQSTKNAENEENSNNKADNIIKKKKASKDNASSDNIVNVLVMDWDDEDQDPNQSEVKEIEVKSENLINESDKPAEDQKENDEKASVRTSVDSVPNEDQALKGKLGDDNQPQRRLGRVIKKKVIFDPDNPDTFTKTKTKNRASVKEQTGKEQTPSKKIKLEHVAQRPKSKSPMSNLQWKKPSSKSNKQNKRLTEVDKLLMDEGAVNMIYQLTPEALKGKKSRETKAEFIKKIQSSTPDSKEMKFRERKKETLKYEDGETKKILGAKHRVLNSSMKSPSVSEDFETHSADDSIIYRRHSSSSYSSSCMSPRRLSDVESCSAQSNTRIRQPSTDIQNQSTPNADQPPDVFMSDNANKSGSEVINKDDYLSIKEKLNSKLSLALNKRKRESIKNDKASKQKKVGKSDEKNETLTKSLGEFKYVTIKINQRLAEICIENKGFQYNIEVLKEIEQALAFVNSIKDTTVTLLTSGCGTLCSSLDIKHVIEENKVQRINNALEVAETIRSLLLAMDRHGKLVCAGVRAHCAGLGLALGALADVLLASERASFALARGAPAPAAAALAARCRLPHSMVNDLILFGRELSASEALQGGLVSKVLWPERFEEQVYSIAKDIASEPASSVMLKKQLLNLKKTEETEQTFLSCLDTERDIFVEYWTSVEGQELLRAADRADSAA